MIRRVILALLLLIAGIALFLLQRSKATARVSARPLLYLLADAQRETERIPLAVTRVSDEEEMKVGNEVARGYGLFSKPASSPDNVNIIVYLNQVGSAVAAHVQRPAIRYRFFLEENKYWVNACALPGGYIIVGRGLFDLLQSEDELAAVLGHEIAHVDNRHAIERLQYDLASKKLGLEDVYQLGETAIDVFHAGYTKEQELEADRVGLELAVRAGYSPAGGVNLMNRFEKLEDQFHQQKAGTPIEEITGIPIGALGEYFQSHPPAFERKAAMEAEIRSNDWVASFPVRPIAIPK